MALSSLIFAIVLISTLCQLGLPVHGAAAGASSAGSQFLSMRKEFGDSVKVFRDMLMLGATSKDAQHLAHMEARMWRTYQALPKTASGRLGPRAVRYIIQNYFSRMHGWVIKGFEPNGQQHNNSELHEVALMQDYFPTLVEALAATEEGNRGQSFEDVVAIAAAVERFFIRDEIVLLDACYAINGLSTDGDVDEDAIHEILRSYLLIFELGRNEDFSAVKKHKQLKAQLANNVDFPGWANTVEFEMDAVRNYAFERSNLINPFKPLRMSFQQASVIVESLAHEYGKWQNTECNTMKDALMGLSPDGSGRVPLKVFYSRPAGSDFRFTETPEILRQIGALEESASGSQNVLVANYVYGPSNCAASTTYISVCCMNACDGLLDEIEHVIQAPSALPSTLLDLVANLESPTVVAPRTLANDLTRRLFRIANQTGGEVHLHGRLFLQWLHYAFPNDCPYPYIGEQATKMTPLSFENNQSMYEISDQEKVEHERADSHPVRIEDVLSVGQWSDDEILLLTEPITELGGHRAVLVFERLAIMFLLGASVVRYAWRAVRRIPDARSVDKASVSHFV